MSLLFLKAETSHREVEAVSHRNANVKQVSLAAMLIALGVIIAHMFWFPFLTTKAFPGQHMINVLAGILLGPFWAAVIAFCIGIIRMSLGIGSLYSMPGGIPGGIIVGFFYWLFKKFKMKHPEIAAFTEPIGTVIIGGTLAVLLVAPLIGDIELVGTPLLILWTGWAISSVPGCILGFIVVEVLRLAGITRETFRE